MSDPRASDQPLGDWLEIPRAVETALEGLTEDDLDCRGGPDGWSIREVVHHLVESNLVAATVAIAAVGTGGCTYDCSWLNPDRAWVERMGYGRGTVAPAVAVLSPVCRYVAALLGAAPDTLRREIKLLGAPDTEPYVMTVEEMIRLEVEHARHHLQEIDDTRKPRPR
ncbi:MAG TPA: DinB family protein [Urbifossiella sp.]|nr:DinB family protein [Urbifossiella sp.]